MKTSWVVLLSAIGLAGCSSTTQQESGMDTILSQSEICCSSLAESPWVRLQANDSIEFALNDSSPVWNFDSNKSYFSSFKFNERSQDVALTIRSIMEQGKVLKPTVALLDDGYNIVRTVSASEFELKFSDAFAKNRYEVSLTVNAKKTPYFIVYGDTTNTGQKVVVPHPAKLRAEQSGEPLPIVTDPSYIVSTQGIIDVEVETTSVSGSTTYQSNTPAASVVTPTAKVDVLPDTQAYYHSSIKQAVESGEIPKALSLLDEAKALGVEGAQEVFVKAVNAK